MEMRKQVLQSFFFYRASGETSREKWSNILSKDFYMTTPITPYRIFSPAEVKLILLVYNIYYSFLFYSFFIL